jgi:hypothetical protein
MYFNSPGINVTEIDQTATIQGVSTSVAAYVGPFHWGPVEDVTRIDSESVLFSTFLGPINSTIFVNNDGQPAQWMTVASALAYGTPIDIVRVTGEFAKNATANGTGYLIKNDDDYENNWKSDSTPGPFGAKYPSYLGNSLKISVCGNSTAFSNAITPVVYSNYSTFANNVYASANVSSAITANETIKFGANVTGTFTVSTVYDKLNIGVTATTANTTAVTCSAAVGSKLNIGDYIQFSANITSIHRVTGITDAGAATNVIFTPAATGSAAADSIFRCAYFTITPTLDAGTGNLTADTVTRYWQYASYFDKAPGTSNYVTNRGGSSDQIHIIVIDEDGLFTGTIGEILETFPNLSVAADCKSDDGTSLYYKDYIQRSSKYAYAFNNPAGTSNWGSTSAGTTFVSPSIPFSYSLTGGVDDNDGSSGSESTMLSARINGYKLFDDKETTQIASVILGEANATLVQNVIDNICLKRIDCVAYYSPESTDIIGLTSLATITENIIGFRNSVNRSTSYGFMDSGYKMMYDSYNDLYRAVPCNGDMVGLSAQVDITNDPWWSFAGEKRGKLKNVVKLYFNPRQTHRDDLYKNGINPIVSTPGKGVYLFGDKTTLQMDSAFSRIGVRKLFIVCETSISKTSKEQFLFEYNNEFTQANFRNIVEPFLSDIRSRQGIYDYKVVCDDSNNTPEIKDRFILVADIYIKPARSINFIQLNFIGTRTSTSFSETEL